MNSHDVMMILVMSIPLILFSVWPGILLSDYLFNKNRINEYQKRVITIVVMIFFALLGATYLHFGL